MSAVRGDEAAVYICGTYMNELGILSSLRRSGWTGPVYAVKDVREGRVLADLGGSGLEVLEWGLREPEDVVELLEEHLGERKRGIVFFSDERFLGAFSKEGGKSRTPRLESYGPSTTALALILDRLLFYEHIGRLDLGEFPRTFAGTLKNPFATVGKPLILRPRRTWRGLTKNPRAVVVRDEKDLERRESEFRAAGLGPEEWAYQEVLSLAALDNVSVCGWHGEGHADYIVTRKVLQHPPEMGNGDVCEICGRDEAAEQTTRRILSSLDYEGPFEMEFVRDQETGALKVIELNPRFWMQNELANRALGDRLVRRYLGLPVGDDWRHGERHPRYWVNTVYALSRILRGDLRIIRYLFSSESVRVPPIGLTLAYLPIYLGRRFGTRKGAGPVRAAPPV